MTDALPLATGKIANDYLDRLSGRLKGMPAGDRSELLNEVRSHIHDSYMDETAGDEIDRILAVLRRLGDPAELISSRMPNAVTRLGKGKKAPLYVLAGILIALLGVPLGLGAVALLVGLMAALFGLLISYYGAGISLAVAGFVTSVICFLTILTPRHDIIDRINYAVGAEVIHLGPFQQDPVLGAAVGLVLGLLVGAIGLLMLWSGTYLWRGFRFVTSLIAQKVRSTFRHLIQSSSNPVRLTQNP